MGPHCEVSQYFVRLSQVTVNLVDKTAVITGAASGIGLDVGRVVRPSNSQGLATG